MALVDNTYTSTDTYDDYTGTDKDSVFGGADDLWGNVWTPALLNDPSFKIVFDADVGTGILRVDQLKIEVFYTLPVGNPSTDELPHADSGLLTVIIGQGPSGAPRFVVAGAGGRIKTSDDFGNTWDEVVSPVTDTLRCSAFGTSGFILAGGNGVILSSADGDAWAIEESNTSEPLMAAVFDKTRGKLVVAGNSGVIRSKTTGTDWTTDRS